MKHKPENRPINYEWQNDDDVTHCSLCNIKFTTLRRKHHCRFCGKIICWECSLCKLPHTSTPKGPVYRSCNSCLIAKRWNEIW